MESESGAIAYFTVGGTLLLMAIVYLVHRVELRILARRKIRETEQAELRRKEEAIRAEEDERRRIEELEEAARREKLASEETQRRYVADLHRCVTATNDLLHELCARTDEIERCLAGAEQEFQDRVFGPFWDDVEKTMPLFVAFDTEVRRLSEMSASFASTRARIGSGYPLPDYPTRFEPVLAVARQSARLRGVVRRAQQDFEFASIYEQRRTNKILIAGFSSLGDAMSKLSNTLANSMDDLATQLGHLAYDQLDKSDAMIEQMTAIRGVLDEIGDRSH